MNITKTLILATATIMLANPVFAQTQIDPGHPRVNEVENRINNQQERIERGEANGTITPAQGARDEKRVEHIQNQVAKDEAKHNGHLTKKEQRRLNKEENKNSKDIRQQHRHGKHRMKKEAEHN